MMRKLAYIDALKGYAILGVIIVHSGGFTAGAMGVQLFYVLSAFTLLLSLANRSGEGWVNFYIRRFFRIAPLFYFALFFYIFNDMFMPRPDFWSGNKPITATTILSKLFFVNGWNPYLINSIVPGGWSISVEVSFYLIVPILYKILKNLWTAIIATLVSLVGTNIIYTFLLNNPIIPESDLWHYFLYFWFPNQLPVFCLGIVLYHLIVNYINYNKQWITYVSLVMIIALSVYIPRTYFLLNNTLFFAPIHFLFAFCFVLLAYSLNNVKECILVNKYACYIGKISYSIYLSHFITIKLSNMLINHLDLSMPGKLHLFLRIVVAVPLTVLLSTLLNQFIEKPGIKLGNRIINYISFKKQADKVTIVNS